VQQAIEELNKALEHLDTAELMLFQEGLGIEIHSIGILVRQATGDIRFAAAELLKQEDMERDG